MLRLHDPSGDRRYIVHDGEVFGEQNGRISRRDRLKPPPTALLEAAADIEKNHDPRTPGTTSGSIRGGARLNDVEKQEFEGSGTAAQRTLLEEHLSFFDPRGTGRITLADNFKAWRALGFPVVKSIFQTLSSSLIFGSGGVITIAAIGKRRPKAPTGVYDQRGYLDKARWQQLRSALEAASNAGTLSLDKARQVVAAQARLGLVPKRQFESLYAVCQRLNGGPSITVTQVEWLYDGSLLWKAAAQLAAKAAR